MTHPTPSSTDVLVVGAGPTGCAAALAFAKKGAHVVVLDGTPNAARRFAGEWMHPPAVQALRHLGVDTTRLSRSEAHGFVLFGEGGQGGAGAHGGADAAPVELPYVRGTSLARIHHELVEELREYLVDHRSITYLPHHSFAGFEAGSSLDDPSGVTVLVEDKQGNRTLSIRAGRVIGADGKKSRVAAELGVAVPSEPVSYMLGVELKDVTLPREGLGHVFFGGPGPALVYRVDERTVRACLDVPVSAGAGERSKAAVYEAFSRVLPREFDTAFRTSLEQPATWAALRFQPRGEFGRGAVWLAGDAVGHVHPVSGMGMTFGILDAVAASTEPNLESYRARREVYLPELLTNVLYLVFRRHDASAVRIRRALLHMLRNHPDERRRTMQILTSEDSDGASFARSFLRTSGYALGSTVRSASRSNDGPTTPAGLLAALVEDLGWLKWPLTALASDALPLGRLRPLSTIDSPLPELSQLLGSTELLDRPLFGDRTTPLGSSAREVLGRAGPLGRAALDLLDRRPSSAMNSSAYPSVEHLRGISS